jgi:hypothetical protein
VGQFSLEVLEGLVGADKGAIACSSMAKVGLRPPQLRYVRYFRPDLPFSDIFPGPRVSILRAEDGI